MGVTTSVVTGSSAFSSHFDAESIIVRLIKSISVPFLPLRGMVLLDPHNTEYLPTVCDGELSREFPILVLMLLVDLTCTAIF
jgi:hypothetical protein